NEFSEERVAKGELTPVFFGSALTNFGVQTFLETFLQFAPGPQPRATKEEVLIEPKQDEFTGFIFKIQDNMNSAPRDRIAFIRIVSGAFNRGMTVKVPRLDRTFKLTKKTQFLQDNRATVNEAVAGEIGRAHV